MDKEKQQTGWLIAVQLILICAIYAICLVLGVAPQVSAAMWSGWGVSILNSCVLLWRMSRADKHASHDARQQLRILFFYAAERFLLVMLLLALAVAASALPWVVISSFVAGQLVMIGARLYLQFRFR